MANKSLLNEWINSVHCAPAKYVSGPANTDQPAFIATAEITYKGEVIAMTGTPKLKRKDAEDDAARLILQKVTAPKVLTVVKKVGVSAVDLWTTVSPNVKRIIIETELKQPPGAPEPTDTYILVDMEMYKKTGTMKSKSENILIIPVTAAECMRDVGADDHYVSNMIKILAVGFVSQKNVGAIAIVSADSSMHSYFICMKKMFPVYFTVTLIRGDDECVARYFA